MRLPLAVHRQLKIREFPEMPYYTKQLTVPLTSLSPWKRMKTPQCSQWKTAASGFPKNTKAECLNAFSGWIKAILGMKTALPAPAAPAWGWRLWNMWSAIITAISLWKAEREQEQRLLLPSPCNVLGLPLLKTMGDLHLESNLWNFSFQTKEIRNYMKKRVK